MIDQLKLENNYNGDLEQIFPGLSFNTLGSSKPQMNKTFRKNRVLHSKIEDIKENFDPKNTLSYKVNLILQKSFGD